MTARGAFEAAPQQAGPTDYRAVIAAIRRLMHREYGVRRISLRTIHSDASRLSMPMKLAGFDSAGRRVRYFAKLMGSQDLLSEWVAQFAKNIYLQISHQDPLFGFARTAEEMARQEYEGLLTLYQAGIPTARPLGYHPLVGGIWLFVSEFLSARPVGDAGELAPGQIDELFRDLSQLHRQGIFHGDIKAANILVGERVYLIDAGVFREGVPPERKEAYDLACLVCTLLDRHPLPQILRVARRYYSAEALRGIMDFADLIQKRQDFLFDDRRKDELRRRLISAGGRQGIRLSGRLRAGPSGEPRPLPM